MKGVLMLGTALAVASSLATAQGPGYGPGYGQGRGMMGGGYGPGMMGSYGGGGPLLALNLTDEQREKVFAIQEEHRKKNWGVMGEMRSEQFKLRGMYGSEKLDANKLVEQQKKVDELRRQMLKSRIETHNQIAAVLTPEQRKQLRQFAPGWFTQDE